MIQIQLRKYTVLTAGLIVAIFTPWREKTAAQVPSSSPPAQTATLAASSSSGVRLNVRDFGAKGNGVADDSPAFTRAVQAAIAAPRGAVLFVPAGRYSLRTPMDRGMIEINGATDLTLEGEAGTLLVASDPTKHMVHLKGCTNVTVRKLALDRDPLVFTQGTITAIDSGAMTVDVTIDGGYDEPDAKYLAPLKNFMVFTDPAAETWDHSRWWPTVDSRQRLAPTKWRFTLSDPPLPTYLHRRWLLWDNTYHGWGVVMDQSQDCLAEDVDYYGGGADAGIQVWQCTGTITYRRFNVGVPRGSDRLLAAAGGGMEFQNRGTVIMDGCNISRVDDDACNMGTTYEKVLRQIDPRTIVIEAGDVPFQAGDTIALWDWFLKKERSEVKIVRETPEDDDSVRLVLDSDVNVMHAVGSLGLPDPAKWKGGGNFSEFDGIDRIADFEAVGKLIVRNCRIQSMRARCLLVKTSDSIIENNTFYNTHMTAILVGPEFYWGEGPAVRNLIIRNNRFINIDGCSINIACFDSDNSYDNRNILIEGNTFENYGVNGGVDLSGKQGTAVLVRNADGVIIRNNKFAPPAATAPAESKPLLVEVSRHVVVKDNQGVANDPPGPAGSTK
jgi:hypothetical protein